MADGDGLAPGVRSAFARVEAALIFAPKGPRYSQASISLGGMLWPVDPLLRAGELAVLAWPAQAGGKFGGP